MKGLGAFLLVLWGTLGCGFAGVQIGSMEFKTYPFGDPDPVPATSAKRYPYFRYDGSTDKAVARPWQTVTLDNGRVKVVLLPEVGGKVWGATTVDGKELLYANHVMKFRDVAMRGPWTSGGLEYNFGILGHAPSSSTPVDWLARTNDDGSVSCFISSSEHVTRTVWQVEVRLREGAEGFETHTAWHNGSGVPAPYYHWMNAAYSLEGNPEFAFPAKAAVGHHGEIVSPDWPFDAAGNRLSRYRNNAFGGPKSYHVIGGDNGYYGIWWPKLGFGSCHRSASYEKFGRKIWLWALSREGGIWEDLLTDADGQYAELQSGRCLNQPHGRNYRTPFKHPTFQPGSTERFSERWDLVRSRSDMESASAQTNSVLRPIVPPEDFDWSSAYGLYVRGEQALRERDDKTASEKLEASLGREPNFVPALTALSELAYRRGNYVRVHEFCRRALAVNAYDWKANLLDGEAYFAEGDMATARDRLGMASLDTACRSAALALIARSYLREGNGAAAFAAAEKSLAANCFNRDALLVRIVARRGDANSVREYAARALALWPLFHAARYELGRIDASVDFSRLIRNELSNETYLELGSWYEESGLLEDAKRLFAFAGDDPRARIRTAFLEGAVPSDDFKVAGVFPFRRESLPALRAAAKRSGSWKFLYLLAVELSFFAEAGEANRLLDACEDRPDEATFYLYRASLRNGLSRQHDLELAAKHGDSWRVGRALAAHYEAQGDWTSMRTTAERYLAKYPECNPIQIAYATALERGGNPRGCLDYLKGVKILPSEHGGSATAVWQAAQKALGESVTWPENLGKGEPYATSTNSVGFEYVAFGEGGSERVAVDYDVDERDWTRYDRLALDVSYAGDALDDSLSIVLANRDEPFVDWQYAMAKEPGLYDGMNRRFVWRLEDFPHEHDRTKLGRIRFNVWRPSGRGRVTIRNIRLLRADESAGELQSEGREADDKARQAFEERKSRHEASVRSSAIDGFAKACAAVGQKGDALVGFAFAEEKILPYGRTVPRAVDPKRGLSLSVARNERESIQIVVGSATRDLGPVEVSVAGELVAESGTRLPVSALACKVVGYVKTSSKPLYPVGINGATPAVGWWPDPILEYLDTVPVERGTKQAFWVRVTCPDAQPAGTYRGRLCVRCDATGTAVEIPLSVRVYAFSVPREPPMRLAVTFDPKCNRQYEGKSSLERILSLERDENAPINVWKRHRPEWEKMLADYYLSVDSIYHRHSGGGMYPAIEALRSRVDAGLGGWVNLGYWSYPGKLDEEAKARWRQSTLGRLVKNHKDLQNAGLGDRAYIYGCDEVPTNYFKNISWAVGEIKRMLPDVPLLTTAYDDDFGVDTPLAEMDWFTPLTPKYVPEKAQKGRRLGHAVWWYICRYPYPPYANIFIESPGGAIRSLMGAQSVKLRPDGFLYYQTSLWKSSRPISGNRSFTDWDPSSWVNYNGDGSWTCCGPDGMPLPTIRLENFRDGLEDYAYARELERRMKAVPTSPLAAEAARLLAVPDALVRSQAEYDERPESIRAWRDEMAVLIEELQHGE